MKIYTTDELRVILRNHLIWLEDDEAGERANLRNANLSGADLSNANLSYANLILIGQDIRGYLFWAFVGDSGVVEICAGCRHFIGINAARAHWTERHQGDAILHEDCLSLIDRCERMAAVRGWKLEPK